MDPTTAGRFRVLDRRDGDGRLVLVELDGDAGEGADGDSGDAYDPVYVRADGYEGDLAEAVADLDPGTVVDATLAWRDGEARVRAVEVVRASRYHYLDGVTGLFEAATETMEATRRAGEAMNSRVTRSTDGDPNGVLYVFAEGPGRDLLAEFRDGTTPVEPLVERVNAERGPAERAVFVMRPATEPFVLVYVVFDRDGVLANTVLETYGGDGDPADGPSDGAGLGGLTDRLE